MMLSQRLSAAVIVVILSSYCAIYASAQVKATDDSYYVAVLESALKAKSDAKQHPKILDKLSDLDKKSKNANVCLVALLDYTLGAGAHELLVGYITKRGKMMLPLLAEKKRQPVNCLPKFKSICLDKETRNESISELEDFIEKGIVIEND